MAEEVTFQNDPVDPSVEFRKQHMAEPVRHTGELDWDGAREWHPATE